MKIVLVGDGFTGATLPLVKRWSALGHKVYCFYYVNIAKGCLEGFDFPAKLLPGIYKIDLKKTNLFGYLDSNISVYIVVLIRERQVAKKMHMNSLIKSIDEFTESKLIRKINAINYDVVNIVGHNYPLDFLVEHLDKSKIFCSVHEVLDNHYQDAYKLNKYTKFLIDSRVKIIVHSKYSLEKLSSYRKCYYIPFGAFETLKTFRIDKTKLHSGYFLFYGYILPYKGLTLLYKTYLGLKNKGVVIPLVIAGKGEDNSLSLFAKEPNVVVLNQYLTNSDLASLIDNCKAVICPYLSASQSGIPQTVNQFGKKVIATKVGAFPEFIFNGENGYLTDASVESLSKVIEQGNYSKFSFDKFLDKHQELNWDEIANKYINLFQTLKI